jgi:hypothetical protein
MAFPQLLKEAYTSFESDESYSSIRLSLTAVTRKEKLFVVGLGDGDARGVDPHHDMTRVVMMLTTTTTTASTLGRGG